MKRAKESASIKECWEVSKTDCIGFLMAMVLFIVNLIRKDLISAICSVWLMDIFISKVEYKIDNIRIKELEDKINIE